jgi:hypothetical protein
MKTACRLAVEAAVFALAGVAQAQYGDYGGWYVPPGSLSFGGDFRSPSYSAGYGYNPGLGDLNMYNSGYAASFPAYGGPGFRRFGRYGGIAPLYGPLPYTSLGRGSSFNALNLGPYRSASQYPPGWYDAAWLDAQLGRTSQPTAPGGTAGSSPVSLWAAGLGPGYVYPHYGTATGLTAGAYTHPGHPGRVLPVPK